MPKVVNKKEKRIEIVSAAMRVFAKKGYAKTKMAEIAEEVEIGKGTIYEYFKDKNDIFEQGFMLMMDSWEASIARKVYHITDPVEKINAILRSFTDFFQGDNIEFMDVVLDFWAEAIRQKDQKTMKVINLNKIYEQFRNLIGSTLGQGIKEGKIKKVNTFMTASLLIGMLDGLMLQWILDKDLIDIKEAYRCITEEILLGIYV